MEVKNGRDFAFDLKAAKRTGKERPKKSRWELNKKWMEPEKEVGQSKQVCSSKPQPSVLDWLGSSEQNSTFRA
jgi:hypothetical protein